MAIEYRTLDQHTWRDDLRKGFAECFHVLKRDVWLSSDAGRGAPDRGHFTKLPELLGTNLRNPDGG
jgi:hypothetical protein